MFKSISERLLARSAALLERLECGLDGLLKLWLLVALFGCSARAASASAGIEQIGAPSYIAYLLLMVMPVVSTLLALRWFEAADDGPQLSSRLAMAGRWRTVSADEARAHPLYGTSGIMVSLLVGMLLNVPVRAAEYLAAMPPVPIGAPRWVTILQTAMTFDVVLFTSLYPIAMQLGIASAVSSVTYLPADVAHALRTLLTGNVEKVLISVCLWLPYLLLSTRVNVTFRQRVPA